MLKLIITAPVWSSRVLSASLAIAATVTVRSGNGDCRRNGQRCYLSAGAGTGDFSNPFSAADFSNAQHGPAAFIIVPWTLWVPSLSADPTATWIGASSTSSSAQGNTALYAVSFTIPNAFSSATLTLHYAVDDELGVGQQVLYLNGKALYLSGNPACSAVIGTANQAFAREDSATCTSIDSFLQVGTNWLYFDDVNLIGEAGIIFSATITTTDVVVSPEPSITSLAPAAAPGRSRTHNAHHQRQRFFSSSAVTFNGVAHPTTYISPSQLSVQLTSSDLAVPGNFPVVVVNPSPGGGVSQVVNFIVQPSVSAQVTIPGTSMPWRYSVVSGGLSSHTSMVLATAPSWPLHLTPAESHFHPAA